MFLRISTIICLRRVKKMTDKQFEPSFTPEPPNPEPEEIDWTKTLSVLRVPVVMKEEVELYGEIVQKLIATYVRKNTDYGHSFSKIYSSFGLESTVIRLFDKIHRLEALCKQEARVQDETIDDTLKDIANYCIMTLIIRRMDNGKPESKETL